MTGERYLRYLSVPVSRATHEMRYASLMQVQSYKKNTFYKSQYSCCTSRDIGYNNRKQPCYHNRKQRSSLSNNEHNLCGDWNVFYRLSISLCAHFSTTGRNYVHLVTSVSTHSSHTAHKVQQQFAHKNISLYLLAPWKVLKEFFFRNKAC